MYMTEHERLRKEFSSYKFHSELPDKCGIACINCKSTENIEYHHVVPLEVGGTNRFTNIVPVCYTCHMKIHMSNFVAADRITKMAKASGRKRKCPENYEEVLHKYLYCQISKSECIEQLGLKNQKISDYVWFKEYLEEHGIEHHRNNLDTILSSIKRKGGNLYNGRTVGNIRFTDGTKKTFIAYDREVVELDTDKFSQPNYRYRQKGVWKAESDKELKLNKDWKSARIPKEEVANFFAERGYDVAPV